MDSRVFLNSFLNALSSAIDDDIKSTSSLETLLGIADRLVFKCYNNLSFSISGIQYSASDDQADSLSSLFLSPSHAYYRRFMTLLIHLDENRYKMERFFNDGKVAYLSLPFAISNETCQNYLFGLFQNQNLIQDIIISLKNHYLNKDETMTTLMLETWSDLISILVNIPNTLSKNGIDENNSWYRPGKFFKKLSKQIIRILSGHLDDIDTKLTAMLFQKMLRTGNHEYLVHFLFTSIQANETHFESNLMKVFDLIGHMEKEKLLFNLLDTAELTKMSEISDIASLASLIHQILNISNYHTSIMIFVMNLLVPISRRNFLNKPDRTVHALIFALYRKSLTDPTLFVNLFKHLFSIFHTPQTVRMIPVNHLFLCKSLSIVIGYLADSPTLTFGSRLKIEVKELFEMPHLFAAAQSHLDCGETNIRECGLAIVDLFVTSFSCVHVPNDENSKKVIFGRQNHSVSNVLWKLWESTIAMRMTTNDVDFWNKFRDLTVVNDSDEESEDENQDEPSVSTTRKREFDPSIPPKKPLPKVLFLRECLRLLQIPPEENEYRDKVHLALKKIPDFTKSLESSSILSSKEAEEIAPDLLRLIRNISPWNDAIRRHQLEACKSIIQLASISGGLTVISWIWQDLENLASGKNSSWLVGYESRLALEAIAQGSEALGQKQQPVSMLPQLTAPQDESGMEDLRVSKTRYFGSGLLKSRPIPRTNPFYDVFPKWFFQMMNNVSLLYQQKWMEPVQLDFVRYFLTVLVRLIYVAGPFHAQVPEALSQLMKVVHWVGSYIFDANASCDSRVLVHPILLAFHLVLSFANENSAGITWKMTLFPDIVSSHLDPEVWLQWIVERANYYDDEDSQLASSIIRIIQQHRSDLFEM